MFIFVIPFIFYIDHNKNLLVMTLDIRYNGAQLYVDLNTVIIQHKIIDFKESCFSSNCDSVLLCKHEWISEHVWLCRPLRSESRWIAASSKIVISQKRNLKNVIPKECCNVLRTLKKYHYLSNQIIRRKP